MHISERAMLADLSISVWGNRKYDRNLSEEVAESHGAPADAGRYNKRLLPKECTAKITAAATAIRAHHYANTLPWLDSGARILPSSNYFPYMQEYNRLKGEFERQAHIFVACYPVFVEEARKTLNGMFREEDYPPAGTLRRRFAIDLHINPLPSAGDFRVALNDTEVAAIKSRLEERLKQGLESATRDLFMRIHDAVSHLRTKLITQDTAAAEGKTSRFHDSTVTNLRELTTLLPRLNIANDPQLDAMCHELDNTLCAREPNELRDSATARQSTIADADKLLSKMAAYVGMPTG